jgi:hypothetical protein
MVASGSDDADLLRAELDAARQLIAAQAAALLTLGAIVCTACHRLRSTAACPWCLGFEGARLPGTPVTT